MKLNEYLVSPGALTVAQLRYRIGAKSDAQLRQWQHGYADRRPSPENCVSLEKATDGQVTRKDLRPDDWQAIWPELAVDFGKLPEDWTGDDRRTTERRTEDRRAS